jgi:hypothetical protein
MMRTERFVVAQSNADRLVTAIHRHKIEVYVDEQITFSCATIEIKHLLALGFANLHHSIGPFGVVVVVTVRVIVIEDSLTSHSFHFPFGHLSMERIGDDDVDIVNTVTRQHVHNNLENCLANVGVAIGGNGKRCCSIAMPTAPGQLRE